MWTTLIKYTLILTTAFIAGVIYDEYFKKQ